MDLSSIEIEKEPVIVFMGTPDFALPILNGLLENYKIRAVVTQPDKVGNRHHLSEPPIKTLAKQHSLLILQPRSIKEEYAFP